jgi:exosortase/archaeosortase family protein
MLLPVFPHQMSHGKRRFLIFPGVVTIGVMLALVLFPGSDSLQEVKEAYARILGNSSAGILQLLGYNAGYELSTDALHAGPGHSVSIRQHLALKYYFIIALLLFPYPGRLLQSILLLAAGSTMLFGISVLRNVASALVAPDEANLYISVSYLLRYTLVWMAIKYRIEQHPLLKRGFAKAEQLFTNRFQLQFGTFILLILLAKPIMSLIDTSLLQPDGWLSNTLSKTILIISVELMNWLNYHPTLSGNHIWLGHNWVYLGSPCLGMGIMTLFALLVLIIRSPGINKLVFIGAGLTGLIVMNSVRIVTILLHIHQQGSYTLGLEVHDLSNYFFYSVVFILLMIYIFRFQYISFNIKKTNNNGTQNQRPSDN